MKPFDGLARRVEREWRRAGGSLAAFPGIAVRALEDFRYRLTLKQLDVELARWLLRTPVLPDQVNLHDTFGQPPVTLHNDGRFVVDLYFWRTFDTSIHSHGFRGAFRVLHGQSLHEEYVVTTSRAVAPDVALVDLGPPRASLLGPGDVRPIRPGRGLTHAVIHLENPTVTLCVKTINEPRIVQWKYFPAGLAVRMRRLEPALLKKIYVFQYLLGQDAARASAFLDGLLRRLDRSTCLNLYGAVAGGALDLSESAVLHFAAQVRGLHGTTEWFRRYEAPVADDDLHFEDVDDPLGRLVARLINGGYDPRALLAGHSTREIQALVLELVEVESLFGREVTLADRAAIQVLLSHPERKLPKGLRPLGQIRKMREFLAILAGGQ